MPAFGDLALAETDSWDVGQIVSSHLASKGFCVVETTLGMDVLGQAVKDVAVIESDGVLRRPPELIVDGLLGPHGSARIAHLGGPADNAVYGGALGTGLQQVDEAIADMAGHVGAYCDEVLGFESRSRTYSVLHESGALVGEAPELTEADASMWMYPFTNGAIMCVLAMGPDVGTLELKPFDAEAQTYSFDLRPGSMVLLRSDAMAARYTSMGRGFLVSCFFIAAAIRPDKFDEPAMNPVATRLNDWATERLDRLKDEEKEDERLDVPRDWIIAMNRQCFKGQHMAVRGMASRMPVSWDEHEFFSASYAGVDYLTEVPLIRWDHSHRYNADPESWRMNQTFTRHFAMIDGCELFDNKIFALTPAESKVMDPHQRVVLENGYEALIKGGYKKGQIMNSTGGMYLGFGTGTSDFNYMERNNDASAEGSFGATGGSAAICSNRFSFCLGMRGPSITIDAEDAASLVSIHLGCEGLQRRGRLTVNFFSLVGGIKLNLSPYFWPQRQAMGISSKMGRCMSFDASADGMALGDNVTNLTLNAMTEMVDNQVVVKEYDQLIGIVAGSSTGHNGRSASFNAPNGPAEQEVISNAVRAAGLSGFDIDASECYAYGGFLSDAVEVSSVMRILRIAEQCDDPLGLTSLKSCVGNQSWALGAACFARCILGNHWGCMTPNVHLKQINPHIDASDQPMCFVTETVEFRMKTSYAHTMARGFGGTNASVIGFGSMDPEKRKPPPPPERDRLIFWPGGGGSLEPTAVPRKGFHVAGTFTQWEPQPMKQESAGTYSYILTLSENRWEQFQIWLDGDPKKCLYPDLPKAPKLTAVNGPAASSGGNAWHIEGRTRMIPSTEFGSDANFPALANAAADGAGETGGEVVVSSSGPSMVEVGSVDRGLVGAQYRIRLNIAGKYRLVDWERLSGKPGETELPGALVAASALPPSTYYVSADFNGWGFQEMVETPSDDDGATHYCMEVQLLRSGGEFQILRHRDWDQALYPLEEMAGCTDPSAVGGPDDESYGRAWFLDGRPGDRFRIDLRSAKSSGRGEKQVSWTMLGNEPLTEEQLTAASRARFAVFGSWDGGARLRALQWTGSFYHFYVELDDDAKASFQLVRDFDWDTIFHPSVADANPDVIHKVIGPSPGDGRSRGLNWTLGGQGVETAGDLYEVRAFAEDRLLGSSISRVEWSRVSATAAGLLEAEAEGLVLRPRRRR